ncbi:putative nucleotidyltransferase, ribonuclease H [Tanacetum coccineum]
MGNVKKSVAERTSHQRQYDRQLKKTQMQTQVSKIDTGKVVDNGLVVMKSNGTESEVQDESTRLGNDTYADDADIRPIYDEEPKAENDHLNKENETLKKHYKDLYDSIKITRSKTIEQTTSLLANNADLKAQIQEKVFAIAALKNDLRKLKGNNVDTKFAKTSVLGKQVLQSLRNQLVVRQPNAFKSERPQMSKQRFASEVDVNNNSSNDMVHNHYLDEARKKTQERDINSKTSVTSSARFQSIADDSKPKPRRNIQTPRSLHVSKSSCVIITVVPKADHSKSSSSFSDSKKFVCSTCHKCVFNANHEACITKLLKEVNSCAKIQSHKTKNSNKPIDQKSHTQKPNRQIFTGHGFSPNKTSDVYEKTSPRSELRKVFASYTSKVDSEPLHGSNVDIPNIHGYKQTLDSMVAKKADISETIVKVDSQTMKHNNDLESLFGPLFDEYFNGENQVVSKYSAVTTADASDKCHETPSAVTTTDASNKRQQQPDSTSSTSTLAITVTANGNFYIDKTTVLQPHSSKVGFINHMLILKLSKQIMNVTRIAGSRAQVDQGSQIKMIQVKEMMQDNDLKNLKSKDKGSKSRSQSMDEQSHYKQDKTITRQSINVKRHIFNVIGGTEEFEERDLNIGGDCSWDEYLCLVEFAYNNSWHASIKAAPFELLYGRKCRAPICWDEVGERLIEGPELIEITNEKVAVAKEKLKEARSRQKSYADKHRRDLEFQVGDRVFLKVSPFRGVKRFGIKGKLSPRFIGPFEILERIGEVSYRLALPPQLSHVHDVFHVSLLRGYHYHPLHVASYPFDQIQPDMSLSEEPESILDRQERVMRNKVIPFVKILWKNHPEREATWETEESMRASYPHFFV